MSDLLFVLHAFVLALVWFVIVNGAATVATAVIARRSIDQDREKPASFWMTLRLLPAAASTAVVMAIFLPSYWLYEPRDYTEGFQAALTTVALFASAIVIAAIARGAAAWLRASRRAAAWVSIANPIALSGTSLPAYRIDVDAPVMALVGIFSPRLFISRSVIAALNDEELAASVAHELGHRRARDNFKRLMFLGAPDFLPLALTRVIEQQWASAAERDADRRASDGARDKAAALGARCALASAIVKVARMMPVPLAMVEPISTLVDGGDIESRVHSLLDPGDISDRPDPRTSRISLALAMTLALALIAGGYSPLLRAMHEVTEVLVQTLP
jgi:Zn-dependent protease with chaperone function